MGLLDSISTIGPIMKKAADAVGLIAAGVAFMASAPDEVTGPDKKKALMDAFNTVEHDFNIDLHDQYVSLGIELIYRLGKLLPTPKASGAASPALTSGTGSKTS